MRGRKEKKRESKIWRRRDEVEWDEGKDEDEDEDEDDEEEKKIRMRTRKEKRGKKW